MGAGSPANQAPRYMARASPLFAGKPAPTGSCKPSGSQFGSRRQTHIFRSLKWAFLTGNTGSSCWSSWCWCSAPRN
ncbi:hypothetical protein DMX06_03625 [Pseudomonas mosselii]|nr:hypothetical protein DMX06_03625 [Pseudomonas mosselii]